MRYLQYEILRAVKKIQSDFVKEHGKLSLSSTQSDVEKFKLTQLDKLIASIEMLNVKVTIEDVTEIIDEVEVTSTQVDLNDLSETSKEKTTTQKEVITQKKVTTQQEIICWVEYIEAIKELVRVNVESTNATLPSKCKDKPEMRVTRHRNYTSFVSVFNTSLDMISDLMARPPYNRLKNLEVSTVENNWLYRFMNLVLNYQVNKVTDCVFKLGLVEVNEPTYQSKVTAIEKTMKHLLRFHDDYINSNTEEDPEYYHQMIAGSLQILIAKEAEIQKKQHGFLANLVGTSTLAPQLENFATAYEENNLSVVEKDAKLPLSSCYA